MKCLVIIGCLIVAICHANASKLNKVDCDSLDLTKKLPDLLEMAKIDQPSHDEALAIFKCKFLSTRFQVRVLDDIVYRHNTGPAVTILRENAVQIAKHSFLLDFIRLFGQSVKVFSIDFSHTPIAKCKQIVRLLRIHCDSLTDLELLGARGSEIDELDAPFQSVRNVMVSGQWIKWGSKNLNFGQLFPNLRRLEIRTQGFSLQNPQSVVQVYPNLQHLHISLAELGSVQDGLFLESIVADLIEMNPTITSLSLVYCSEAFLNDVIAALPNLESLRLTDIRVMENKPYIGNNIVMENIRNLEIVSLSTSKHVLRRTTFPQLEELTLELSTIATDELNFWMYFITKHTHIVFLKAFGFVNDNHLLRLRNEMPELTNLIVKCDRSITTDAIAQYVLQSKQLINFELRNLLDVPRHSAILETKLNNEWKIESFAKERRLKINRKM